jgi:hypothetical protein
MIPKEVKSFVIASIIIIMMFSMMMLSIFLWGQGNLVEKASEDLIDVETKQFIE